MRVAVLSDTHIPVACNKLPGALLDKLKGADLIIHAGDLIELSVLDELNAIAAVEAVWGNMDPHKVRKALPEKKLLRLGAFKIGLTHGFGPANSLIDYAKDKFKDEKPDCIIYGHSHRPSIDIIENVIYFNPGSPTDRVFAPYNSFGILEITDKLEPQIIRL